MLESGEINYSGAGGNSQCIIRSFLSFYILSLLRLLVHIGINLSSIVLGELMLIVFGCIVFTVIQHTWNSMAILIAMEVFLVLITASAGLIESLLEMASDSLGGFMRS